MRKLTILVMVIVLTFTATTAVSAHDADPLRGSFEGGGMPVFDPEAVAARCPAGFQWILQTFGAGHLDTDVYEGDFTFTGGHCSRFLAGWPDNAVQAFPAKIGDGAMTLATPEGDLVISYAGTFVFRGDVTIPEYTSQVRMQYKVAGAQSTGVFEDASGRGPMFVVDNNGFQTGRLHGSITIDD